jgi:hypothetical protein
VDFFRFAGFAFEDRFVLARFALSGAGHWRNGYGIGAEKGLGCFAAEVAFFNVSFFVKDVSVKYGAEKQRHGYIHIKRRRQQRAIDSAAQNFLQTHAGWLHHAMTPGFAKLAMHCGICDHGGHHALAGSIEFVWRLAAEDQGKVFA